MTEMTSKTKPRAFAFVGASDTGKTALIERLIPEFTRRGFTVGTVKHNTCNFEIDHPGKDSYRHKSAGSVATVIASPTKLALVRDTDKPPKAEEVISAYLSECDIVLVEGYAVSDLPKIWVRRRGIADDHIDAGEPFAVVTDGACPANARCFPHDAISQLTDLLVGG